jgi:hypothetical protein
MPTASVLGPTRGDAEVGLLPDRKAANCTSFELLIFRYCPHDRRNIIARFHQQKFSWRRIFNRGQGSGDARSVAGNS